MLHKSILLFVFNNTLSDFYINRNYNLGKRNILCNLVGSTDFMSKIEIRQSTEKDLPTIKKVIEAAFRDEIYSDHKEHILVEKLHNSTSFIPKLSLIATKGKTIIGYILLTKVVINNKYESLALAPLAVLPEFQGQGIGGLLINRAHQIATELGYTSVILVGLKDYYPRFGYKPLADFGIQLPFDAPQEYELCIELVPNALSEVSGKAVYPKEFFEN